jgi:Kdo2-lipid IVA lauroyltransferase/acyltransferase
MLIRIVFHLLARLPLRTLHGLGGAVGTLLWWTNSSRKKAALKNISMCLPELPPAGQRALARASLQHEMRSVLETPFFWLGPVDQLLASVVETRGEAVVEQALARGKGIIMLTLHLGGWEAPGHLYASRRPITAIYKKQGGVLEELGVNGRTRTGAKVIPISGGGTRARILPLLQNNEAFYFMPDQEPPEGRGVFAPFFGVAAHTPTLVGKLAQESGAAVVFMYGERLPRGAGYIAHYSAAPAEVYDPDPVVAARALNREIERCVRACPEQFWWSYKRFRRRPPGEPWLY